MRFMVRGVLQKCNWMSDQWLWHQMSYNILVSVVISCNGASIRVENQCDDFVKIIQDRLACFHLFRFYIHFVWIKPQSIMEDSHQFCLTTMQFIRISSRRIHVIFWVSCARYYCLHRINFKNSNNEFNDLMDKICIH